MNSNYQQILDTLDEMKQQEFDQIPAFVFATTVRDKLMESYISRQVANDIASQLDVCITSSCTKDQIETAAESLAEVILVARTGMHANGFTDDNLCAFANKFKVDWTD